MFVTSIPKNSLRVFLSIVLACSMVSMQGLGQAVAKDSPTETSTSNESQATSQDNVATENVTEAQAESESSAVPQTDEQITTRNSSKITID